ncbi:MAG: hypothetical protein AAGF86_00750 [Pseudomonadota bacterium]
MTLNIVKRFGLAVFMAAAVNFAPPAEAQDLINALRNQGYSQIKITKQTFNRINFEACQDGIRYQVKMTAVGRVRSKTQIGECRRPGLSVDQVRRKLREDGYNRIKFTDSELPRYVAEACRRDRRVELVLSRRGEIRDVRRIGRCAPPIDPRDIARVLRDQGYSRIKVTDNQLPRYAAEACRRGDRFELRLNRYGEIRNEKRIGTCRRPINPDQIARILREKGFNRIQIVDDRLPRYVAEACRANDRVEVTLNRFGDIVDQLRVRGCRPALNAKQFLQVLRDRGYRRIRYRGQDGTDFLVRACYQNKRYRARFSQYGEVLTRRNAGPCVSTTLDALSTRLRKRGMERVTFFVEGCRNGWRYRTRVDAFGDAIERERLGRCN